MTASPVGKHASGGPAMLAAARTAATGSHAPRLLAVTVLTSMDIAQLAATGIEHSPAGQVELIAHMAIAEGIRGFVCSSQEVENLRRVTGPDGVLVIPGIRLLGTGIADQRRVAAPGEALRNGASYLVVGRPITQVPDPAAAAEEVLKEMATAL